MSVYLESRVGDESCVILQVGQVALHTPLCLFLTQVFKRVDEAAWGQEHCADLCQQTTHTCNIYTDRNTVLSSVNTDNIHTHTEEHCADLCHRQVSK